MKKIMYIAALLLTVSCGVSRNSAEAVKESAAVSDTSETKLVAVPTPGKLWGKTYGDYVFHDDFYYGYSYYSNSYEHYALTKAVQRYGLIADYSHKEEIEAHLNENGFEVIKSILYQPNGVNQYWLYLSGKGDITQIPHTLYYTGLYQLDDNRIFGVDNEFIVKYDGSITTKDIIVEFAKIHNVQVGRTEDRSRYGYCYIYLYCSNASSGNAVEMANWFVECGGFVDSFPSLGDAPIDLVE